MKKISEDVSAALPQSEKLLSASVQRVERSYTANQAIAQVILDGQRTVDAVREAERSRHQIELSLNDFQAHSRAVDRLLALGAAPYKRWTRKDEGWKTEAVDKVVLILSDEKIDWHAADTWVSEHRSDMSSGMLAAIIERAIRQAIISTSKRATRRRQANAKTKERAAIVLGIWSADTEAPKGDLAHVIAGCCESRAEQAKAGGDPNWDGWNWSLGSVRKWLQGKTLDDVRKICAME
jgi:hypothetical protein